MSDDVTKRRFHLLDGLRGYASIFVLLVHLVPAFPALGPWTRSGYLAVDFFFMLSGFVVANAYEPRLRAGFSFGRFAEVRAIRLYPLYLLGCAIGFSTSLLAAVSAREAWPMRDAAWALPWALAMLPRPSWNIERNFTLNPPAWSLFFELVINLVYARIAARAGNRLLIGVVAAALVVLIAQAVLAAYGHDASEYALLQAAPHVVFAFPAGVLIYRAWHSGALPRVNAPAPAIQLFFVALLLGAARAPEERITGLLVMAVGFPLVIVAGVTCAAATRPSRVLATLGDFSYPLYATHLPCLSAAIAFLLALGVVPGVIIYIAVPIVLLVAWMSGRYYDPVTRRLLTRLAHLRRREVEVAPAL